MGRKVLFLSIFGFVRAQDSEAEKSKSFFDWDDKTVDGYFCHNSRLAFFNGLNENGDVDLSKLPEIPKKDANKFLKTETSFSVLKFGGFFERSLERVSIEEYCDGEKLGDNEFSTCREKKRTFVNDFCKESDSLFFSKNFGSLKQFETKLNSVRKQKYDRCMEHVKRRMTQVMGKLAGKEVKSDEDSKKKWQMELKPDRLFRGWWHELQKAFLRVCMTDKTDCARKCSHENGVCQLAKDPTANEDDEKWVYECQCQPDYEPVVSSNTDPMVVSELCNRTKVDAPKGSCSPLRHAKRYEMARGATPDNPMTELRDTIPVDHQFLCTSLRPKNEPWNCDYDIERETWRKRRAIGSKIERNEFISQTDFGYFPWVVELNHYPSKNFKKPNAKIEEKVTEKDKMKGTDTHRCSGTLIAGNKQSGQDFIITAAHCFCAEQEIGQWLVRIGIIDNTKHLNLYQGKLDALTEAHLGPEKYVDVTIDHWQIGAENEYLNNGCKTGMGSSATGKDDFAILYLNGRMRQKIRESLQHNVRHSCVNGIDNFNQIRNVDSISVYYGSKCFLAGWGSHKKNEYMTLGIPKKSNFINVKVVPFEECRDDPIYGLSNDPGIDPDELKNIDPNNSPFICAKGFEGSSSCAGDSGGGLFCFSEEGQSVHLLGPLHGTTASRCEEGGYMYFANLAHEQYRSLIEKKKKKATQRDEL